MGTLPATGTTISMGRAGAAYYATGTPTTNVSIGNSATTRHLNSKIGRGVTTSTAFSSIFGGRVTPFTY